MDYKPTELSRISAYLATIAAALLPIVTVVILHHWTDTWTRIKITICLTAAFAVLTKALTSASRVEVFTATAA